MWQSRQSLWKEAWTIQVRWPKPGEVPDQPPQDRGRLLQRMRRYSSSIARFHCDETQRNRKCSSIAGLPSSPILPPVVLSLCSSSPCASLAYLPACMRRCKHAPVCSTCMSISSSAQHDLHSSRVYRARLTIWLSPSPCICIYLCACLFESLSMLL